MAYETYTPFRHTVLAVVRCSRVADAAIVSVLDYKMMFSRSYGSPEEEADAYSQCHTRSAKRVLKALLANGGIFIKLGQHMASLIMLPVEWTTTMRPLQDQCEPTSYEDLEGLFLTDMGKPISEIFDDFSLEPIGVASLAQVHVARDKESGRRVAVKLQHPHLAEFCDIDMEMVDVTLGWIKYWFPEFELTWLAEEMRTNLPKEMDFIHEANNARRAQEDFRDVKTSLYIPEVLVASKRVLVMEFIQGGRVDDLPYLSDNNIDRNSVALELSRIFNRMVFLNGFFHADPHPGNLLIRPSPPNSKSPYSFEIVLLDHGLYFDLTDDLRVNYAHLWLSLIAPASKDVNEARRKYAQLVGNIGPDLYPIFETAMTGRASLEGAGDDDEVTPQVSATKQGRASGVMDLSPPSEGEVDAIRNAVMNREGLLLDVLTVLRHLPRRVLMVLKLNDLTRHLDHALMTTHSNIRIFVIMAKYCTYAVWREERQRLMNQFNKTGILSFAMLCKYFAEWWRFEKNYRKLVLVETMMDFKGRMVLLQAWLRGLYEAGGLEGAHKAAAGVAEMTIFRSRSWP